MDDNNFKKIDQDNWWRPQLDNEWWEKSREEDFLSKSNNSQIDYAESSSQEYLRIKKVEELINEKLPLQEEIPQARELLLTVKDANQNILEKLALISREEDSLIFKNIKNLFDHHFSDKDQSK